MSDVEALRTLVDAIEDELRTHQPMTYPAGLFIRIKTVLEGLVSDSRQAEAPTGDDPAQLHNAIRETVIRWEDCGGNIEHMLKESLSGFRLPVVPVPVYEYGYQFHGADRNIYKSGWAWDTLTEAETFGAERIEDEREVHVVNDLPDIHLVIVRRVPASEWELVPVGVDKP